AGLPRALVNVILNDEKYSLKDLKKMNLEELFPIVCEYEEKNERKRDFVKSLDEKSDNYDDEIQKFANSVFELPNKKFQKLQFNNFENFIKNKNKNIDEKELNESIMFNARPNECMLQNNKVESEFRIKVNNNLFKVQEYPKFPIHENAFVGIFQKCEDINENSNFETDVEANVMNQKRQNEDNYQPLAKKTKE
ncbi:hypothetical protein ROZALSC1DRAFT_31783, partial [Rozella allomycis CSF55]